MNNFEKEKQSDGRLTITSSHLATPLFIASFSIHFYSSVPFFLRSFAQLIKDAETAMQASGDRLVELDAMIVEAQNNRTDADTTIQEILERHPEIAAEIQQEIKDDKWFSNQ